MNDKELFYLTRSASFLWKSSLATLAAIVAVGSVLWILKPESTEVSYDDLYIISEDGETEIAINTKKYAEIVQAELLQISRLDEKLYALKYLLSIETSSADQFIPSAKELPHLSEQEYRVLAAFGDAMRAPTKTKNEATPKTLLELANHSPPIPYANYALSLFFASYSDTANEIKAAKAEIANYPSPTSRNLLIEIFSKHQMLSAIKKLQSDPDYAPFIDSFHQRDIALETMDWPILLKTLIPVAYEGTPITIILLTIITGVAWAFLLLRINGKISWSAPAIKLAVPALLLGALSAHLTILAIYLQEDQLGLAKGNDLISQAIYCFAGIGFREEFLKLLCFTPLIPFLIKRKNELEILIVASLVGLGFAIEENVSYFENSQGIDAIGRFITANFFHLSLTGLCGLTLCQALMFRGAFVSTAVSTFGIAVLAHGAYDAFIIVPELSEYAIASSIIFILVSYQFFIWLRHLRPLWRDPISISAQFTFSLVLVFGASYLLLAWDQGPINAISPLAEDALGLGILLVMFYREIPEDIS